nr:DMT family transporter [Candidatus Sigynarchaeota archaeon]
MDAFLTIFFGCVSYCLLSIGQVLQKKGASELPAIEVAGAKNNVKNFMKNRKWFAGFMIGNFQIVFFWLALAYGPISLVSPMAGVGILVLVACSVYYLKERIIVPMYLGIIITAAGIVIIGAINTEGTAYSWAETLTIIASPQSIIFLAVLFSGIIISALFCISIKYKHADIYFGVAAGFSQSLGNLFSKYMTASFSSGNALGQWQFYLFLALLVTFNFCAMILQQVGYQKGKAVIISPIVTVSVIVYPSIAGIVIFSEWGFYSAEILVLKSIAFLLLVVGVAVLSFYNTKIDQVSKTTSPPM